MLNILIVTSQVTYVPGNYQFLLEEILKSFKERPRLCLKAVISLKSIDASLGKKIATLPLVGVFDLGKNLLKNLLHYKLRNRHKLCASFGVKHLSFDDLNHQEAKEWIKAQKIDLIINLRTRCLFKEDLLKLPQFGCVNIHHGLLPQYRGTFCDLYALYERRSAGFSLHHMEKKVDSGLIYDVVQVDEGCEDNYENYLKKAEQKEIKSLNHFLKYLNDHRELPQGKQNICEKPVYTKNPTPKIIKLMRLRGLKL